MSTRVIWIFLLFLQPLLASSMTDVVKTMISKNKITLNKVSVIIKDAHTGRQFVSINANTMRKPASVMKVFTTYSALLEFGPNFRWPTKFYYKGKYSRGTIHGDLIVKGYGDPTLSSKDIPRIVHKLKRLGIRAIDGNIILDRSFFHTPDRVSSGFDRNKFSEYNAMPDAIMFNDHLITLIVKSDGRRINVYKSSTDNSYKLINKIIPTNKKCSGSNGWPRVLVNTEGTSPRVTISGTISRSCSPRYIKKLVTHSYKSFYYALVNEMKREGIKYHGTMRLAKVSRVAKALFVHHSMPLIKILAKTSKHSINLYARHLMLLLGGKLYGAPSSKSKGEKAEMEILSAHGLLHNTDIKIDNGCGLSRISRITANTLSDVLHDANRRYGSLWRETLSVTGVDGTTRRRFKHSIARGRAWMKTGTLNDAKNIAGYVLSKSTHRLYNIVVLYNGKERWKGSSLQNQIINWLAR